MQSRGDPDSLLPLEVWAEIADAVRYEMLPSNIESLLAYFYKFSIIAYENSLELIFSLHKLLYDKHLCYKRFIKLFIKIEFK